MVATLYDVSLDQYYPHYFPNFSNLFKSDNTIIRLKFSNRGLNFSSAVDRLNTYFAYSPASYVHFPREVRESLFGYQYGSKRYAIEQRVSRTEESGEVLGEALPPSAAKGGLNGRVDAITKDKKRNGDEGRGRKKIDLSGIEARKNLNETAFFYPHLKNDRDGSVTISFKMPEALTEWRFMGFAHTTEMEYGSIEARTVTRKQLMVQPNPPRFLREGDVLEFTVKVTNMTDQMANGSLQLLFTDPVNESSLDARLKNIQKEQPFSIPPRESRTCSFQISVPDNLDIVAYCAVGATQKFSDGEQGVLPVLSRRIFVRESLPLWISGKGERQFKFKKLLESPDSKTLVHKGLTVQMTSNPAWYAIQALPYLMEFPYECSEQVFNRLYANGLARKIANSDPKIRRLFDLWKGSDALRSNLEKNEDLKSVLLRESPWVRQAKNETRAKHRVGLLFENNRMDRELKRAYSKLKEMQLKDGSWPWFPGGRGNRYITLYIVTGFGRLKHLGVDEIPQDLTDRAIKYLDNWILEVYQYIVSRKQLKSNNLTSMAALYLYGRSYYLSEKSVPARCKKAVDYFLYQAREYWLKLNSRQNQAQLALALNRFGFSENAKKIMRSIRERSQLDEEMGRFWGEMEYSWWWFRAPIETQAVMIEAFDEVMNDHQTVEECKVWLLKQKQTRDWKTTKATADAVYALILRGQDLLASDTLVEVRLGGQKVEVDSVEAGTGYYEKYIDPKEILSEMGNISVIKKDKGIAWGGVHWQYMEDISRITPHTGNPLTLKKRVFVRQYTKKGPVIKPVEEPLQVGDLLVVRIELRVDRDLEYVHMKDHRASGLEPVNVLSRYKYQDGLAYYESTKDTASHFFIDYLPKGTYVFEYSLRVVHKGSFQNGMAHIECMYAPEFNSHSDSVQLQVK
ncbi:MAG: alpha-2-macroglobulin family protein [Candidatus Aminicenantes bacterium]|nr:alpha-2-macroglobulin family protein [Candidatus Aminicenantes bacterium]